MSAESAKVSDEVPANANDDIAEATETFREEEPKRVQVAVSAQNDILPDVPEDIVAYEDIVITAYTDEVSINTNTAESIMEEANGDETPIALPDVTLQEGMQGDDEPPNVIQDDGRTDGGDHVSERIPEMNDSTVNNNSDKENEDPEHDSDVQSRHFPGEELTQYIEKLHLWNQNALYTQRAFLSTMQQVQQTELSVLRQRLAASQMYQRQQIDQMLRENMNVFYVPPVWKRAVAELIDFLILFVMKLIVTFMVLDTFKITTHFSKLDFATLIDNPRLAVEVSTEVAFLEFVFRIVVCIYEMYWTKTSAGTPGKRYMGLRVIHAATVVPIQIAVPLVIGGVDNVPRMAAAGAVPPPPGGRGNENRSAVRVFPGTLLSWRAALLRSVLKNVFVGLLMSPVCFSFIFVNQNRTGYDVITNSMVVEFRPNALLEGPIWN